MERNLTVLGIAFCVIVSWVAQLWAM